MDMVLEQFKVLFDRPEKVKKLRELILQLAVRGKLVEQDESDEPAAVLLERIREEKDRLVKEGKIKKEKPLLEIREEEKPYELPKGWEWCRLIDSNLDIADVDHKMPDEVQEGIPYISPRDFISGNGIDFKNAKKISDSDYDILSRKVKPEKDDIIFPRYGTIGVIRYITVNEKFLISYSCATIKTIKNGITPRYIKYYLESSLVQNEISRYINKTTQPNVGIKSIKQFICPLPPLNEQQRIIEKLENIMAFCDNLEKQLERKVKYNSVSSKSVFNSIGNCSSAEELEETLRFIIENFKDLTLGDGAVKELKNAILQLAVQGKLVSQDPSDEPASVLLEKIKEEKERLIGQGKIKREKELAEISEDEKPYELPNGWEWIRLGDYTILNPRNSINDNTETSFIPMKLIADGFSNKHESEVKVWSEIKSGFTHFAEGDVVVAKITPCFENRKSAVMKNLVNGYGAGTTELYVVRSILGLIMPEYILSVFKTETFISGGVDTYTGTAGQQRVKKDYISNLVIALPPLNEQKCIVEKVNLLMSVCDELEERIEKSRKYSGKLLEALLKQTF